MNLLDEFTFHNNKHKLFSKEDRILVSCSGGRDSIVLAHLLYKTGYKMGLMYFDHQTREGASLTDGLFVARLASKWDIPFYYQKFQFLPQKQNSNFQNLARTFRYSILENTQVQENYTKIATGHHQQDVVESFFINLSKKSGLDGLLGIDSIRNKLIRPLLHFSPQEIADYAVQESIQHITDKSNFENNYKRNKFRNTVLPGLINWDKNIVKSSNISIGYLQEANNWIEHEVSDWSDNHIKEEGEEFLIPLQEVKKHHSPKLLLFRILKSKGFNMTQVNEILLAENSGQIWINDRMQINLFQATLYVSPRKVLEEYNLICFPFKDHQSAGLGSILIHESEPQNSLGKVIRVPKSKKNSNLVFRKWQSGDYMKLTYGRKKLKKIFLEEKIPSSKRPSLWVLANENEVFWIEEIEIEHNDSAQNLFFIELLKK